MSALKASAMAALLVIAFVSSGCSGPDRLEYVKMAAREVCDEARRCDNLGPEGFRASYDDCIIEEESRFNSMWPANRCDDGRIDPDRFDRCMDRARLVACEGSFFDWLSAAEHCSAGTVCVN